MNKKNIEGLGHNYPFNPNQSPYSKFEERIFPKLLIFGAIVSVLILFSLLYYWYNFDAAMFFSLLFSFFWALILGPIIVKLMIRRREKLLTLRE